MLNTLPAKTILDAQRGHSDQLTAIYQHYHLSIFRYLYYRVGDRQTAEDITSDVFVRMIRSLDNYRLQGIPFQAWLFRIARNLAIDHFRRTNGHDSVEFDDQEHVETSPEHLVERSLTSERLQQALAEINEQQRDVIVMRFVLGMSINETAQAVHRSEDAVKGLQRRGLMTLRECLKDLEVFDDYRS